MEDENLDEAALEELQDKLEIDYQIGEDLKDKVPCRANPRLPP